MKNNLIWTFREKKSNYLRNTYYSRESVSCYYRIIITKCKNKPLKTPNFSEWIFRQYTNKLFPIYRIKLTEMKMDRNIGRVIFLHYYAYYICCL